MVGQGEAAIRVQLWRAGNALKIEDNKNVWKIYLDVLWANSVLSVLVYLLASYI